VLYPVLEAGLPLSISFRVSPAHTTTVGQCEIVSLSTVILLLHGVSNEMYPILKRQGWVKALEWVYFGEGGRPKLVDVCVILLAGDRALNPVGMRALKEGAQPSVTVLRSVFLPLAFPFLSEQKTLDLPMLNLPFRPHALWSNLILVIPCSSFHLSVSLLRRLGFHSYPRPWSEVARVPTIIHSSPRKTLTLNLTLIYDAISLIPTFTHWVR